MAIISPSAEDSESTVTVSCDVCSARNSLKAEKIVEAALLLVGEDPGREGLKDTPRRVVSSWAELFGGYRIDPVALLGTTFKADGYDEIIMLRDVEFFSTCEHHMLPFFGRACVGYIPLDRVVGVSKLARVVDAYARRLQIQERLTTQIADAVEEALKPKGVMVVLEAQHLCMVARGVGKQHSRMVTSAIRGVFDSKPEARAEFLSLASRGSDKTY